jgi:hypothetical protein
MFLSFCKANRISVGNPVWHRYQKLVDIGRWLDFNEVRKYVGQGGTAHQEAVENSSDGKDPVGRVWFFRSAVRSTAGGEFYRAKLLLLVFC